MGCTDRDIGDVRAGMCGMYGMYRSGYPVYTGCTGRDVLDIRDTRYKRDVGDVSHNAPSYLRRSACPPAAAAQRRGKK